MSRSKLSSCSPLFLLPLLSLLACGGEDALSPADEAPLIGDKDPVAPVADCDPDAIMVGAGGPLVSRTATITVRHGEAPADLQVWVEGPDGKHSGELFPNESKTVFLPTQPYPANAELHWNVLMCGEIHTGVFRTGSLLRPVPDAAFDEVIVGHGYALDLRVGRWSKPFGDTAESLVFALGGALLLDVVAREHGIVRLAVSAAHPDNAGGYMPAKSAPVRAYELPWGDNPYAFLELEGLTLETSSGEVRLREALLGVGFDKEGVAEASLSAQLEVSEAACDLLDEAGVTCRRCADGEASCVDIAIDNLYGIPL